ncbi:S1 family peptidase [Mangrovibacterium diazotrophicum]|uniref:Trypsin-like peptidase n=1 Tax=Mangrovibacterium diazotrophicum TaxID=1261403 RepID=A0A419VVA5_9BACT|nr:serine protease [Mangrovibacterium diazotrophicum]RKD86068.1 trypsin-like peptidase [Mangrovibacterium diazotrophicum]
MRYLFNTLLGIALFLVATTAQGQYFKNNIREYKARLAGDCAKLIDSGKFFLTADSLSKTFQEKGYGPVDVRLKPMKKKKLTPGQIYDRVSESIVIVSSAGRCGEVNDRGVECKQIHTYPASGYIINSEGIIVTNYHVVEGYVTKHNTVSRDVLVVMLKDQTIIPVTEVLLADKANDLAIIRIDPKGVELTALPVATKDAEIGDPVFIVSHPKGYFYAFSSGMVTDKFSQINAQQYRNLMAISADFAAGSSGSAIIDQYGNVIATVDFTKTLQHSDDETKTQMVLKATIPSSALLKLIEEGN